MIDEKTVRLMVEAQFKGKATITGVTKSIADLETALDKQVAAAKRGDAAFDELKATLSALQIEQSKLEDVGKLIGAYQRMEGQIGKVEARVERTTKAYDKYKAKLDESADVTEKQQARLVQLSQAQERAAASLQKQQGTQAALAKSLADAGVATDDFVSSEKQLATAAAQVGISLQKNRDAISSYADNVKKARDAERELAAAQQAAAKERTQFDTAAARADAQRAARAKAAAEVEDAARNRNASAAGSARTDSEAIAAANRARELAALQKDIVERSAQAQKNQGLANTADDAERAARGYTTLARASADLSPKVTTLRDALNSIRNPGAAAASTLEGVEKSVEEFGKTINAIKGPVKDYQAIFKQMSEAQKALVGKGELIDNFRQQTVALREARTAYTDARAKVAEYAAAVRAGGDSGAGMVKSLNETQTAARAAAVALQQQLGVTRQSRTELRAAGVATNDLASAEQRLVTATTSAVNSTKQLNDAVDKYGQSTEKARKGGGMFGDEGRTTLSYLQRIRGEVLALATAYVGLQGSIELANGAIEATKSRESSKTTLGVGLGTTDKKQVDAEYEYVKQQSERIGLVFQDTVAQYGKFSTAAAKSGRDRKEIRYIFEAFAEGGRVLGLTTDNLNGVFLALEQIFSKGKLGAEELRQQLGERLPGVFEVAQQALRSQFPDLNKAMEQGKVGAEQLVLVAEAYRKMVAEQLPGATQGLTASQARMTNAVNDFKLAIADAGWAEAYANALKEMTKFLQSDDGARFAKSASTAFSSLAQILVALLENFDALKLAGEAFLIVIAGKVIVSAISRMKELGGAAKATAIDFKSGASIAGAALVAFQAALIGWEIGTYLRDKFVIVRQAGTLLVTGLMSLWATIKASFETAWEVLPTIAYNAMAEVLNTVGKQARLLLGIFAGIASASGLDGVADALNNSAKAMTFQTKSVDGLIAKRKAQLKAELLGIQQIRDQMLKEDAEPTDKKPSSAPTAGNPTPFPGKADDNKKKGPTEAEIKKRESMIEQITRALETLDAKIDRAQTKSLSAQLDAVDTTYAALKRKIDELGGAEGKAFKVQLDKSTAEYKAQITKKFNDDLLKEQEGIQRKLEALDAAAGRKSKTDLDARLKAVSDSYESTYREIEAFRATLVGNGRSTVDADNAKARLDAGIVELKALETQKFYKDEIARRETEINDLLTTRAARIRTINDLAEGSLITEDERRARIKKAIDDTQPALVAAADEAAKFSAAISNPMNAAALDTLNAKAQLAVVSGQALTQTYQFTKAQLDQLLTGGALQAFESMAQSIGNAIAGTKSWGDAIRDTGAAFANFAADFLKQIAMMILKTLLLQAIQKATGGVGVIGTAATALLKHSGGLVGAGASQRTRSGLSVAFANAPRYHNGGMPGLANDEYATILKRNEEVLSDSNPRNILNGGAAAGTQGTSAPQGMRFVFLDDRAKVPEAMASAEGERVILETIRRNGSTVRQYTK